MSMDPFERLAPFIQSYIYQNRWQDLRDIQKNAIPAIMDTDKHVLIMSGTASGKTEAALLPVLTLLEQSPPQSVGALYIGPLKALINDQFERIQQLLYERPDIPVQGWHGDIAYAQKMRFLKQPRGILQITPESMEALLMNRPGELGRIFGDLRFVIIDEIHAFLGTERGQQVLCHLQRLERALRRSVRRIGLSATIGDKDIALRWLESSAHFPKDACIITESTSGRKVELRVNHFVLAPEEDKFYASRAPAEIGIRRRGRPVLPIQKAIPDEQHEQILLPVVATDQRWELHQTVNDYYDDLFARTRDRLKTLIFTNRRDQAERIAAELRTRLDRQDPGRDWYFVHHSSIAANLREAAETKMRDEAQQSCTIATASLELGIDIGHLDLTVQIHAPHTVSSFVQRLGRSGRRGTPSRMCFYTFEYLKNDEQPPTELQQVPWNFLQTIAIIQLYIEDKWIEPPDMPTMPLSLLYQQTMSIVRSRTELSPPQLAQAVLTLKPFQAISRDEYQLFLRHLLTLDQLERMAEGTLIIGMKGEQLTGHYHFYAIFANAIDYRVLAGTQELGTIQQLPEVDSVIGLAGYAWKVLSVDERGKTIRVERAGGVVKPAWLTTGGLHFHHRMMQRLRQVLQEETLYSYLSPLAQQRLSQARKLARNASWLRSCIFMLGPGSFALVPWTGSRIHRTLVDILEYLGWCSSSAQRYYIEIVFDGSAAEVLAQLHALSSQVPELVQALVLELKNVQLWQGKYDYMAPRALLEKAYVHDVLDVSGTIQWLANCS